MIPMYLWDFFSKKKQWKNYLQIDYKIFSHFSRTPQLSKRVFHTPVAKPRRRECDRDGVDLRPVADQLRRIQLQPVIVRKRNRNFVPEKRSNTPTRNSGTYDLKLSHQRYHLNYILRSKNNNYTFFNSNSIRNDKEKKNICFNIYNLNIFDTDVVKQSVVITSRGLPLLPVRQRPDLPCAGVRSLHRGPDVPVAQAHAVLSPHLFRRWPPEPSLLARMCCWSE